MKRVLILAVLTVFAITSVWAATTTSKKTSTAKTPAKSVTTAKKTVKKAAKPAVKKDRIAVIKTNKGTIKFRLYEKDAPNTAKNFISLAQKKFYDGLTFHRVEPGFVIQGGDPKGNGSGGSGKNIKLEVNPKLKHDAAGVVAMARAQDPDSASCQFYITLDSAPFLDMKYAVFGRVTEGLNVVKKISVGDKMISVRIVESK